MYTNNPFDNNTNNQLVDRLIGKSYEVVKAVYLHLDQIKALNESNVFNFLYSHWTDVTRLINNENAIREISYHIDEILEVPTWLTRINQAGTKALNDISLMSDTEQQNIASAGSNQVSLINTSGNSYLSQLNTLATTISTNFNNQYESALSTALADIATNKQEALEAILVQETSSIVQLTSKSTELLESFTAEATDLTTGFLASIREEASKVKMYSYRYASQSILAYQTYPVRYISPNDSLKVGDHIITWDGQVFEIASIDFEKNTFTVGEYLHSLRGPKGEAGNSAAAVVIRGWVHTMKEFWDLNLKGKPGDAWVVANDDTPEFDPVLMVWDPNSNTWQEIPGIQGPPGASCNLFLMDPDPEEYFRRLYGDTLEDYHGMLLVTIKDDEVLYNASYSSKKLEELLKDIKDKQAEINNEISIDINKLNTEVKRVETEAKDRDTTLETNLTQYIDNSVTNVQNNLTTEITNIANTLENNESFKENIESQVNEILDSKDLNTGLATDLDSLKIKFDNFVMHSNNADFVKMFNDTLNFQDPEPEEPGTEGGL